MYNQSLTKEHIPQQKWKMLHGNQRSYDTDMSLLVDKLMKEANEEYDTEMSLIVDEIIGNFESIGNVKDAEVIVDKITNKRKPKYICSTGN